MSASLCVTTATGQRVSILSDTPWDDPRPVVPPISSMPSVTSAVPVSVSADMPKPTTIYRSRIPLGLLTDPMPPLTPIMPASSPTPPTTPPAGECAGGPVRKRQRSAVRNTTKGKKTYQCHCGKTFTTSGHLARHNRIHMGEKNYECRICHSRFSRRDNCSQHTRTHFKNQKPNSVLISSFAPIYLKSPSNTSPFRDTVSSPRSCSSSPNSISSLLSS
ncbi:transcriptional regulator NRG1 [Schizosaccharomyces japonicus yFS275]|uniref:Transcriptional regulator NRG1 n=1 Tax=Schizosaccharomyces japonicus (strain yFS275 / FY16936) TaxID=402676 RepID=B6JXI3_SCHJY|nr:transcriptional regulator NRG1 [Schizosaccharomyces japonicus yFS275]EEB05127.1 transcriptional regulator NRG1 [Schizosaccharomyces japonicus yFS275]